jgi:hypothetical protein
MAKQEAARPRAANNAQRFGKPTATKKEESEDEEEGRAATFKSKRQRKEGKKAAKVDSDDEDEETRAKRLASKDAPAVKDAKPKEDDGGEEGEVTKPAPTRVKTKPKSFLDEILADRSKKGKKSKA